MMNIDDKIILCEVAREAINGRFREWLTEETKAEEAGDKERAEFARKQRQALLRFRRSMDMDDIEQNQRIIKGDFEPQAPVVAK